MLFSYLDKYKIDESPDCISVYDKELNIIRWSNGCADMFNISRPDAIGKPLIKIFPYVQNDYRVACLKQAINECKSFHFPNLPYHYRDGYYTQLILPKEITQGVTDGVISIMKNQQTASEHHSKKDLVLPLLKNAGMISLMNMQ